MKPRDKNKWFANWICRFSFGLIGIVAFADSVSAGRAYLSAVGAPDLRFQTVTTNYFVFSHKPKPKPSIVKSPQIPVIPDNATNVASAETLADESTNAAISSTPSGFSDTNQNLTVAASPTSVDAKSELVQPFDTGISSPTASDLLVVTPQMIANYLKPNPSAADSLDHHGAVVFVPSNLQFTPPTPNRSSESRAAYHSR